MTESPTMVCTGCGQVRPFITVQTQQGPVRMIECEPCSAFFIGSWSSVPPGPALWDEWRAP